MPALEAVAHALKGAAANLTGDQVADAARALEIIGRDGLSDAAAAWTRLEGEAVGFMAQLREAAARETEPSCVSS